MGQAGLGQKEGRPGVQRRLTGSHVPRQEDDRNPARATVLLQAPRGADTHDGSATARFAGGREVEADAVIGADGIRSAIRAQLFGADKPRFTEMMCWRAMVPMEHVPTRVGPGASVELPHGEYFGWIGPNGHVICYPIHGGELYNMFVGRVSEQWEEESWTVPSSKVEMLAAFAG